MTRRSRRLTLTALSIVGLADALYMLAYHEGLIDHLVCPFFGSGCDRVGRSAQAKHFGVPNALVGALGYTAMATLAVLLGDGPARRHPLASRSLGGISAAAVAASAVLTYEQRVKVRAWCFWCLLSAAINAAILPLALAETFEATSGRTER